MCWIKASGEHDSKFQVLKITKHFGINTMYSLWPQIYKIYISSSFFFPFFLFFFLSEVRSAVSRVAERTARRRAGVAVLSSGGASCAAPGGRSGRSCGCTPRTGTAWRPCASGSGGSAHPTVQTSSRSLPSCTCRASRPYESSGELLNETTLYKLLCNQGNRSSGCVFSPDRGYSFYCI